MVRTVGVYEVTLRQLDSMPDLAFHQDKETGAFIYPRVGDWFVVSSGAGFGFGDTIVYTGARLYDNEYDAVGFADFANTNQLELGMTGKARIMDEYEVWHVVPDCTPLEFAISSGRDACRDLTNDCLDYRAYECRCFAAQHDHTFTSWDEPDDIYVGNLCLWDYDACERFARCATSSGILLQVEIWAEFRASTRGYNSWEHVRVKTFRSGWTVM